MSEPSSSSSLYRGHTLIQSAIVAMLALGAGCDAVFGLEIPDANASASADAGSTDGGPTDGGPTDALVADPKRVFVTSTASSGNLGGIAGADAKCNALATAAGLSGTFLAWLSDATTSPAARFPRDAGPYLLVNGVTIASSWEDLTDGSLAWPIAADEWGAVMLGSSYICTDKEVWSNTTATGEVFAGDSCNGWTSSGVNGSVGNQVYATSSWTLDSMCPMVSCSSFLGFYCFEQ